MNKTAYYIIFNLHYLYIVIISILLIFLINKHGRQKKFLKFFIWYPKIALILMIINAFFQFNIVVVSNRIQILNALNCISDFFHFFILGYILLFQLPYGKVKIVAFAFFTLICLILVGDIYYYSRFETNVNSRYLFLAKTLSSFFLSCFCIIYFLNLLRSNSNDHNSVKDSTEFWIVSGVFVSMVLIIPLPMIGIVLKKESTGEARWLLLIVQCFCYLILNSFFLKGVLCLKQMERK